ncbi:MAG TPA: hypothetical protein VLH56_13025 [Dissulfurispiraceae bacterium]|nr:hypothetical protein [Dissulfurispiraceae bacterium]
MFQQLVPFQEIKDDQYFFDHILWEVEPKDLMEPRTTRTEEGVKKRGAIKGYVFYIDVTETNPQLFLLRHTAGDYAETVSRIDDIPEQMLHDAIAQNIEKEYFKMYPINQAVKEWLLKALREG